MDPETNIMGQLLSPKTDRMSQFLGPETDIMGEWYYIGLLEMKGMKSYCPKSKLQKFKVQPSFGAAKMLKMNIEP